MVNINTLGIGVYDSTEGTTFQMRGIYSGNTSIVVALDAGNNAISITLNIDQIIDDLPQATTTQRGVGETATDAEAIAKASITTFLTPSNLAALGASLTFAGLVELATDAETQAGLSSTLAVTPAGLASVTTLIQGTETWPDAATRAGATPDFDGQLGAQLDDNSVWLGVIAAPGGFSRPLLVFGETINPPLGTTTVIQMPNAQAFHILTTDSASEIMFSGGGEFIVDCPVNFSGQVVQISSLNIANSLLGTDGSSFITSFFITDFLSNHNTNSGWTNFTNSAVRKTGDCNTITLPQLAQVVDTLIQTLGTSLQTPIP